MYFVISNADVGISDLCRLSVVATSHIVVYVGGDERDLRVLVEIRSVEVIWNL